MSFKKLTDTDTETITKAALSVKKAARLLPSHAKELGGALNILEAVTELLKDDFNKPLPNNTARDVWDQEHSTDKELFRFGDVSVEVKVEREHVVINLVGEDSDGFTVKQAHRLCRNRVKVVDQADWF